MSNQLVSVIIIFLNAERFILEAIESVIAQTYPDWELWLVDDGSVDRSKEIACEYARRHPERIHYLTHPERTNRGMSASRNLGIQHARGDYIAFLDADDVWISNTLKEQVAILDTYPEAALVYGPLQYWYSWTGDPADIGRDYIESLGVPPDSLIRPPKLLPLFLLDKAAVPSGMLIRQEAIKRVGGFENTFRGEYEDQVFCAKICLNAPVYASNKCWYLYRQHPNSSYSVGQQSGQTHSARLKYLNWLAQYLTDQDVQDPGVWCALRHELWRYNHPRLFWLSKQRWYLKQRMSAWLKLDKKEQIVKRLNESSFKRNQ